MSPKSRKTAPLSIRLKISEPMSPIRVVSGVCIPGSMIESALTDLGIVSVMYIKGASACVQ